MRGTTVFFYELHEGDDDIFSDVLLVRDEPIDPDDLFDLVQSIRRRVQGSYETDTLIEAIALELEREHGFTYISDDRVAAAVNVSVEEDDNFLIDPFADDDEDARDANELREAYRSVLIDTDDDSRLN
jgi:hypothetical protein